MQIGNTPDGIQLLGAPGKQISEKEFIAKITQESVIYRLPEYVTSFLLARDVELEFDGSFNRNVYRNTVSCMTRSCPANYFYFSTSIPIASYSRSSGQTSKSSKSKVHRTANGMKIQIPGAQVIGYYTQKLPRFPAEA